MIIKRKKTSLLPAITIIGASLIALIAKAEDYKLLAPIKDVTSVGGEQIFANYLSSLIPFILAAAAMLAAVQIIVGGIEYALSEAITDKSDAKDRMMSAITGLALALVSFLILNTINPELVKLQLPLASIDAPSASEEQQNNDSPSDTGAIWTLYRCNARNIQDHGGCTSQDIQDTDYYFVVDRFTTQADCEQIGRQGDIQIGGNGNSRTDDGKIRWVCGISSD